MPRWLFSVILFVGVASIKYEFKVPNVRNPDLTRKQYEYERPESSKIPEEKKISLGEAALKQKSREFGVNVTDEELDKFNEEANIAYIKPGMFPNYSKLHAYRITVIDHMLLGEATDYSFVPSIDFLDEYMVTVPCSSLEVGHTYDRVFIFRNKIHYAKFYYICPRKKEVGACEASTIMTTPDNEQGYERPELDNLIFRTVNQDHLKVRRWRSFYTCEKGDFTRRLYPDLAQRLSRVGLYSLYENFYHDDPNAKLALRLVGQQLIRSFREEVPDFTKERIDALEHKERWYWQNKYEHEKHLVNNGGLTEDMVAVWKLKEWSF
ncbi:unnamed protein product [Caenorhabditis sp. 36 PRJEB53466]|nr:unnamed protein product [Caenorhabditis sp. 36 PRJEB53466]